ncbi:hypothetical protein [Acaryochloris marina]|uniref:Uncharacterized protein n=1 Tax=Acaryochloris marina (strain MBIC 11017) TaxID=329726 RepID=A8ZPJ1_ACAM1|nr:hypothetical protein [Acaryochloris marina]ABW32927.1 hypothetical protein AM1_E0158 [Acaryochloris marina MBIC11017]
MTQIPSLTHQQLELLRIAKKNTVGELRLSYEYPVLDDNEPQIGHPPFIQELIDHHFIHVQVKETSLRASEFQQENWIEHCDGIDYPHQADWDRWRQGFITQLSEEIESLMIPGKNLGQFTQVWIREISVRAVQPSSL